jgi:hypothetical protein
MLADPIYLGYYAWNKRHFGKFHRYKGGQAVLELNFAEKSSKNDPADWVQSHRLFPPLVDQRTWDAVQRKLGRRPRRSRAPRAAALYLAGLVYCGNCGGAMVAGPVRKTTKDPRKDGHTGDRYEYFCGTYHKAAREGWRKEGRHVDGDGVLHECKCLRNGVFQDVLEGYVARYLEETGKRLELLTAGTGLSHLTDRLEGQEAGAWQAYQEGFDRLTAYLAEHHPAEYARLLEADAERGRAEAEAAANPGEPAAPEPWRRSTASAWRTPWRNTGTTPCAATGRGRGRASSSQMPWRSTAPTSTRPRSQPS